MCPGELAKRVLFQGSTPRLDNARGRFRARFFGSGALEVARAFFVGPRERMLPGGSHQNANSPSNEPPGDRFNCAGAAGHNLTAEAGKAAGQGAVRCERHGTAQRGSSRSALALPLPSESIVKRGHLSVANSSCYHAAREALSQNTFRQTKDSPWPTAVLDKGRARGQAQLVPVELDNSPFMPPEEKAGLCERAHKLWAELSDLDADVLDLLTAIWLNHARTPNDLAIACVDGLLSLRALQKKKGGANRRGGFHPKQRRAVYDSVQRLENLWINLFEVEIYGSGRKRKGVAQSRTLLLTSRIAQKHADGRQEITQFTYRLGEVLNVFLFGPGRQTALLSVKAVEYDPLRQKWEKRLARYLSWQWRIQASRGGYMRPFKVRTLLDVVGATIKLERIHRIRERLHKALDALQDDEVIASWQCEKWNEPPVGKHNWGQAWL